MQLLRALDELPHPGDALIVISRGGFSAFIFPVGGDSFFSDAVHFLCADLHFKRLAAMQASSVEGLVKVWVAHGNVIFEAAWNGAPNVMHHTGGSRTVSHLVGECADGAEVG